MSVPETMPRQAGKTQIERQKGQPPDQSLSSMHKGFLFNVEIKRKSTVDTPLLRNRIVQLTWIADSNNYKRVISFRTITVTHVLKRKERGVGSRGKRYIAVLFCPSLSLLFLTKNEYQLLFFQKLLS